MMLEKKPLPWVSALSFVVLSVLLLRLFWQTWIGPHNRFEIAQLQATITRLDSENERARIANQQVEGEIDDLRNGLQILEEHARLDLNMIKPDETLIVYTN